MTELPASSRTDRPLLRRSTSKVDLFFWLVIASSALTFGLGEYHFRHTFEIAQNVEMTLAAIVALVIWEGGASPRLDLDTRDRLLLAAPIVVAPFVGATMAVFTAVALPQP